jgi:hypothetical protein
MHRWVSDQENPDELTATWTDSSSVLTVSPAGLPTVSRNDKRFVLDGHIDVTPENRLTTVITVDDSEYARTTQGTSSSTQRKLSDVFTGQAAYNLGVPRAQRNAQGVSTQHYRLTENGACYDRTISTKNGTVTGDVQGCD